VQGRVIVNGVIQNANAVQAMHVVQPAHAAPATQQCSACGATHPIHHRFCGQCGHEMQPASSFQMVSGASSGPAYPSLPAPPAQAAA